MRISLPRCHDQFIKTLAQQMNCSPSEALTYLLWEVRRQGFSFAHPLPLPATPTPIAQTATAPIAVTTQTATAPVALQEDEVVKRFAMLIEEF